jgi:cellulose synthase/poly-beta-1,6-N-acetylglucosamine synthase-like glycosyltransferase
MLIFFLLNGLFLAYLAWGAVYQFIFSAFGVFYKNNAVREAKRMRKIAVFIPAYKEDGVIVETVQNALSQQYPQALYHIIVIADSLQKKTLSKLKHLPIQVIEVAFDKSTKSKAINKALQILRGWSYDIAIVLDADNTMKPDFLSRINDHFEAGTKAIQGRRMAKNEQTGFALLDAASEDINNHILCKGHRQLGLSARLAGSGMAFDYRLFKKVMAEIDAIGGFDKEMELRLTRQGITVEYDENAVVFDEKVSQSTQFSRQRSRWLAAQYNYARTFLGSGIVQFLLKGNVDFFNKTLQMTLPPRLILPFALFFGTVVNAFCKTDMTFIWLAAFGFNVCSFLMAMPKYCFDVKNIKMWLNVPLAFGATLIALTRIREASQRFIHTPHVSQSLNHSIT